MWQYRKGIGGVGRGVIFTLSQSEWLTVVCATCGLPRYCRHWFRLYGYFIFCNKNSNITAILTCILTVGLELACNQGSCGGISLKILAFEKIPPHEPRASSIPTVRIRILSIQLSKLISSLRDSVSILLTEK